MNITCILLSNIFLFVAIAFFLGIAPNWIKEWREMPKQEQQKIRIDLLSKNVGCVFLSVGVVFMISGLNTIFKERAFMWCMIIWLIMTGLDIAFISKSKRYKRDL